jgi:hypothetical protein
LPRVYVLCHVSRARHRRFCPLWLHTKVSIEAAQVQVYAAALPPECLSEVGLSPVDRPLLVCQESFAAVASSFTFFLRAVQCSARLSTTRSDDTLSHNLPHHTCPIHDL